MELSLGSEASVCVDTSPSIALGLKDGTTMMLRHPLPQQEKCNQDNVGISCSFILSEKFFIPFSFQISQHIFGHSGELDQTPCRNAPPIFFKQLL